MPPKAKKAKLPANTDSMESLYIRHYKEQTAVYGPHTAILLQVGRFFEMYDAVETATGNAHTNVQTLAEICGCSIEPKPTTDPTKQKIFWGFPEPSLPKFERLLILAGYSVVVIVQNKDGADKVVSRTIDHVSSPGTYYEDEGALGVRQAEQCLIGMYIEPYVFQESHSTARPQTKWYVALSAFNINTGEATSMETHVTLIDDRPVCDAIQPFLAMYPPAEAVVWISQHPDRPDSVSGSVSGMGGSLSLQHFRQILGLGGRHIQTPIHLRSLDKKLENSVAEDRLRLQTLSEFYKHDSSLDILEYLGIARHPMTRRSLSLILQFIKDHNPSYLQTLSTHSLWEPEDYLILGNAALEQLSMICLNSNKSHESLLHWLQRAETAMGRRALRKRCLTPITDIAELNARQDRIQEFRETSQQTAALKMPLKGMYDLPRLYRRFVLGKGSLQDVLCLLSTYKHAKTLLESLAPPSVSAPDPTTRKALFDHIDHTMQTWDMARIRTIVTQVSATSAAPAVGSVHPWVPGVYPALDALETQWTLLETQALAIRQEWNGYLKEEDAIQWMLKDDAPFTFGTTSRRASSLQGFLKGTKKGAVEIVKRPNTTSIVFLQSAKLKELNTAAITLRVEWLAATEAVWHDYWKAWSDGSSNIPLELIEWIAQVDCEIALASVAETYGYVRPHYITPTTDSESGFSVKDLRHPIIERVRTSSPYIPHSVSYGVSGEAIHTTQGLLVYGVNAAGKSSFGKAVGLAILMAQMGSPVPATEMSLIPYNGLYTRILGNDNLWAGMSSFVVEMTEFRSILRSAASRILVIGDELCAGTETASATAIVAAGIQTLVARGAHFLFATHLHELADIPEIAGCPAVKAVHLAVHTDPKTGILTYDRTLKPGHGSPMYGLEVCKGLDMDPEFLTRAFEFRKRLFTSEGLAHASRYNPAVIVARCEVCNEADGLETHHIVPQAAADKKGKIKPGTHKNATGNLVVLCSACHDAHHGGQLMITGWKTTTAGRALEYYRTK